MILSKLLLVHPVKFKSGYGLWLGMLAMPLMLAASAHMGIELDYMSFGPAVFCVFALLCIWVFERTDMAMVARAAPKLTAFLGLTQTFGILTYCVYAVHESCYLALGAFLGDKITLQSACLIFVPFVGFIIALAYVLYRLVEKPFDTLRV
jgi:peptidoglycan/LPS O-acetylase OafA/YrhL